MRYSKKNLITTIAPCALGMTIGIAGSSNALADVSITEFHYDNVSTDSGEAIEVAGPAGTDLTGWTIVLYNGNGGASYNTLALQSNLTQVNGCTDTYQVIELPTNGLQNGSPDGIALVDNFGVTQEFISYEGSFTATNGPASGLSSIDIGFVESGTTEVGFSLQKIDGLWQAPAPNTFGSCSMTVEEPDPAVMLISAVQGTGESVTTTNPVIVNAIVTASYLGSNQLNGFYLQEEDVDVDSDPQTSEGIFVYCPACTDINIGDQVEVTGTPEEYFGLSQISAQNVQVLSSNHALPTITSLNLPISFDPTNPDAQVLINGAYESVEGMLVQISQALSVSETYNLNRYGEILLSANGRFRQFTDAHLPSIEGFNSHQLQRVAQTLILDDGSNQQNRDPIPYPAPGLSSNHYIRGGDILLNLTGVMSYGFSNWRIQPVFDQFDYNFIPENSRPDTPASIGMGPRVASFNVLNYFTSLDDGSVLCGPNANLDCRGANNAAERARQQAKLTLAICEMDADIVGLMELENSAANTTSALDTLVTAVNSVCGGYKAINTGPIGTDAIRVGLIYKPGKVSLAGITAVLDTADFLNPNQTDLDKNRPAIAQTFIDVASSTPFTVVVNHLKSKGSDCSDGIDPFDDDTTSGQGNCNGTRTQAVLTELAWLRSHPTGITTDNVLVIGDLNAYRNEDPISAFKNAGFTDLVDLFNGREAYGYVFNGEWGYLDHALASAALSPFIINVADWHINSDEVPVFDYNEEFKPGNYLSDIYTQSVYRTSDHDPLLIELEFPTVTTTTLTDILSLYIQGIESGDIQGTGRYKIVRTLSGLLFQSIIARAQQLERAGKNNAACALVKIAIKRSDGKQSPADLIIGDGVNRLNKVLIDYSESSCHD